MELLCALLTGFFFWLLVYQWRRKSIARWREVAGEHLCTALNIRARWGRWVFLGYFGLALIGGIYNFFNLPHLALQLQWEVAVVFAVVLMLGIPATRNIAVEVRRRGLFCSKVGDRLWISARHFVPWNQIATCQWVPKQYGVISRFDDAFNRLTIAQEAVSPETKAAVTAAMGQFAPVYDHEGTLLAKPSAEQRNAKWVSWRDMDRPRFQFDLQTLMLLAVVVACAASLVGIQYRTPEAQALRRLAVFDPQIRYWPADGDVYELDFSGCVTKLTDNDMVYLEPLLGLRRLDLAGSAITDAGLDHLKELKKLDYVNLANTSVTEEGMRRLRRALPKANIQKSILWVPPNAVPLTPTLPRKGK